MKASEFKKIIKEAVREVFKEEFKDMLLETIKHNSNNVNSNIKSPITQPIPPPDRRKIYMDILNETALGPKSSFEGKFNVDNNFDTIEGELPKGELSLDQIMNLTRR